MQIVKKAALLAATAGTLALLGTGTAVADGFGGDRSTEIPTNIDIKSFIFQNNDCDTLTGTTAVTSGTAPTGDLRIGSNCANIIGG